MISDVKLDVLLFVLAKPLWGRGIKILRGYQVFKLWPFDCLSR